MELRGKKRKGLKPDRTDRDEALKEDLKMEINVEDLAFDQNLNSYELDVINKDPDYIHHDPYDTAVENGRDANSDFDESNPTAIKEYDKNANLENDLEALAMHVESDKEDFFKEESFSETSEDSRDDLDLEGYPKNDR